MQFDDGRDFAGIVCEAAESAKKNTFAPYPGKGTIFIHETDKKVIFTHC